MGRNLNVFLYTDYPSESLNPEIITEHLNRFGISAELRGGLFEFLGTADEFRRIADLLAGSVISDIETPLDGIRIHSPGETNSEPERMAGLESVRGTFYDGLWLQRVLYKAIADRVPAETGGGFMHMIFTGRLFGTYDGRRYHARVILAGSPALISTSGLVEAPAKPREYYFIKGGLLRSGKDTGELDRIYRGRYVEYDDPKISMILRSYALQAVYCELTGNDFCDNPGCCIYNSHWQEEVLEIQYRGDLCEKCVQAFAEAD